MGLEEGGMVCMNNMYCVIGREGDLNQMTKGNEDTLGRYVYNFCVVIRFLVKRTEEK